MSVSAIVAIGGCRKKNCSTDLQRRNRLCTAITDVAELNRRAR